MTPDALDLERLQQLLESDRQRRVQACQAAIAAALEEYRCQLSATPFLTNDGRVSAQVLLGAAN